jgi:glyoxylase-like metal-dependent hydrolase (beta-lactamase superfamily II)
MKIIPLKKSVTTYSCRSYLLLGTWNRVGDLNTVIDPGTDEILAEIEQLSTGFGKVAVEQIILTHTHFDHMGGIAALKRRYGARVLAFNGAPGVDELIHDGQFVKAGDEFLEVIHIPNHSSDSICLYAPGSQALFSGDTHLRIRTPEEHYSDEYLKGLDKLAGRNIQTVFSGHDEPHFGCVQPTLQEAVSIIRNSRSVPSTPNG